MDLYLRAADEAAMNAALIAAGLAYEKTETPVVGYSYEGVIYDSKSDVPHTEEVDEDGDVELIYPDGIENVYGDPVTYLLPAPFVSLDVIGPIVKWDYSVDPPVEIDYPEWHVNVRSYDLTEEQLVELESVIIVPPEQPFRVWA